MFRKSIVLFLLVTFAASVEAKQRGRGHGRSQSQSQSPRAAAMAPPRALGPALGPAGSEPLRSYFPPPSRNFVGRSLDLDRGRFGDHRGRFGNHRGRFDDDRGRFNDHRRWPWYGYGSYYALPYTGYSTYIPGEEYYQPAAEPAPPPPSMTKGLLRIELTPAVVVDYYIDGHFIGSSATLGMEFEVNAGARQVEARAPGYKPVLFDARIEAGQITTLRGMLEAIAQAQPPRAPGNRVMYVIPGCYIGNAKPEQSALPAGCDVRKLVTRGNGL
jgi:hypothetical protein